MKNLKNDKTRNVFNILYFSILINAEGFDFYKIVFSDRLLFLSQHCHM